MAATHLNLEKAIVDRGFREDLYYRLNVINLHVPPLRERKDDLEALAAVLIERHSGTSGPAPAITPALKQAMMAYHWPGNVRELENFVRRLIILRDSDMLARELQTKSSRKTVSAPVSDNHVPAPVAAPDDSRSPILEQVTKAKQRAEVDAILAALNATRWNRKRAATLLKIDYKALLYKMKRLGVEEKAIAAVAGAELTAAASMGGSDPELALE
jgi:two-component system response regulator AtoC